MSDSHLFQEARLSQETRPDVALARVPALSHATFQLPFTAEYRGLYPKGQPTVGCAFPFGIWTSKRSVERVSRLMVLPFVWPIESDVEFQGRQLAEVGTGQRLAAHGEFMGLREFRSGDTLKSIHWPQTARQGNLIVCERGGPQQPTVLVKLSTSGVEGFSKQRRDHLAWRVRIAASLCGFMDKRRIPYRLAIDGVVQTPSVRPECGQYQETLALIQLYPPQASDAFGSENILDQTDTKSNLDNEEVNAITISAGKIGDRFASTQLLISIRLQASNPHLGSVVTERRLDLSNNLISEFNSLLGECCSASRFA